MATAAAIAPAAAIVPKLVSVTTAADIEPTVGLPPQTAAQPPAAESISMAAAYREQRGQTYEAGGKKGGADIPVVCCGLLRCGAQWRIKKKSARLRLLGRLV